MLVTCPMHDGSCGEQVEAHGLDDFDAAQVSVDACSSLLGQGWTGPQLVASKTHAIEVLTAPAPVTWQHRDGLVTFGAM